MKAITNLLPILFALVFSLEFLLRLTRLVINYPSARHPGSDFLISENLISPLTTISYLGFLAFDWLSEFLFAINKNSLAVLNELYSITPFIWIAIQALFLVGLYKRWRISWSVLVIAVLVTPFKDGLSNHGISLVGILIYMAVALYILWRVKKYYFNPHA